MNFKKIILLAIIVASITACGSESDNKIDNDLENDVIDNVIIDDGVIDDEVIIGAPYSGSELVATLSEGNKTAYSEAVTELVTFQFQRENAVLGVFDVMDHISGIVHSTFISNGILRPLEPRMALNELNATTLIAINSDMRRSLEPQSLTPAGIAVSDVIEANCGGSASISGSITEVQSEDDTSYTIEYLAPLTVTFNDFCIGANGEFTQGLINGTVILINSESKVDNNEFYTEEYESHMSFNEVIISTNDIETGELFHSTTLNGKVVTGSFDNGEDNGEQLTLSMNVSSSDAKSIAFTLTNITHNNDTQQSISFIGSNGKTYKSSVENNLDERLYEPNYGYVSILQSDVEACYGNMGPSVRMINLDSSSAVTGYIDNYIVSDEEEDDENVLRVRFGSSEDESCSLEPTSVELTKRVNII